MEVATPTHHFQGLLFFPIYETILGHDKLEPLDLGLNLVCWFRCDATGDPLCVSILFVGSIYACLLFVQFDIHDTFPSLSFLA
jgi:hypothetical protein